MARASNSSARSPPTGAAPRPGPGSTPRPSQEKAVWFALPLPCDWPGLHYRVHPGTAAHHLLLNLTRRGFEGRRSTTGDGLSVLVLTGLNVWVHRRTFCWWTTPHRYLRRPLIDLQETTELLVRHLDTTPAPAHSPKP